MMSDERKFIRSELARRTVLVPIVNLRNVCLARNPQFIEQDSLCDYNDRPDSKRWLRPKTVEEYL